MMESYFFILMILRYNKNGLTLVELRKIIREDMGDPDSGFNPWGGNAIILNWDLENLISAGTITLKDNFYKITPKGVEKIINDMRVKYFAKYTSSPPEETP